MQTGWKLVIARLCRRFQDNAGIAREKERVSANMRKTRTDPDAPAAPFRILRANSELLVAKTGINPDGFVALLRDYNDYPHEARERKLGEMGLFLKTDSFLNSPDQMRYQFDWLTKFHRLMPENMPKPFALIEFDQKVDLGGSWTRTGYLMEYLPMVRITQLIDKYSEDKESIGNKLREIVRTIHEGCETHSDLYMNTMIRTDKRQVIITDPLGKPELSLEFRIEEDLKDLDALLAYIMHGGTVRRENS